MACCATGPESLRNTSIVAGPASTPGVTSVDARNSADSCAASEFAASHAGRSVGASRSFACGAGVGVGDFSACSVSASVEGRLGRSCASFAPLHPTNPVAPAMASRTGTPSVFSRILKKVAASHVAAEPRLGTAREKVRRLFPVDRSAEDLSRHHPLKPEIENRQAAAPGFASILRLLVASKLRVLPRWIPHAASSNRHGALQQSPVFALRLWLSGRRPTRQEPE